MGVLTPDLHGRRVDALLDRKSIRFGGIATGGCAVDLIPIAGKSGLTDLVKLALIVELDAAPDRVLSASHTAVRQLILESASARSAQTTRLNKGEHATDDFVDGCTGSALKGVGVSDCRGDIGIE